MTSESCLEFSPSAERAIRENKEHVCHLVAKVVTTQSGVCNLRDGRNSCACEKKSKDA